MGFFGGPHCIAMCGGVCNFFANQSKSMFFLFQLGRLLGYGLLGIAAAILLTSVSPPPQADRVTKVSGEIYTTCDRFKAITDIPAILTQVLK